MLCGSRSSSRILQQGSNVPFRRIGEKRNKRDLTRLLGCEKHLQSAIISYRQTKGEIRHHRQIGANRSQGSALLRRLPVYLSAGETKARSCFSLWKVNQKGV